MSLKDQFLIRPDIHFLNFGSFGAAPKPVFEAYQKWQLLLEQESVQFIAFDGPKYLAEARQALATYINCDDKDNLVFVTNPSYAVNIVARGLDLKEGDEILATDIEYGACDRTWDFYCTEKKALYRRQHITLPITTKEQFVEDFFKGYNEKTKAVFISHITSATALILPVKEICARAKELGMITIVDGAHVPGHIPFDLSTIQADFYTGACHKWMMAPKGCSFLYAHPSVQHYCDPLVVSWGYKAAKPSNSRFLDYHQMIGTRDFSAFCTLPTCVEFMAKHNWPEVARYYRNMVREQAPRFFELLNSKPISPLTDDWLGQMISVKINTDQPELLQRTLFTEYKVEVPIMVQNADIYLRYSLNAFNTIEDLDALYNALVQCKERGLFKSN